MELDIDEMDGYEFERFLGIKLSEKEKELWKPYQPYVSRHWCAISLLIRTKIETKNWDTRRVQMYLGHDKQRTTDSYIEFAEEYYRQEPKDWFSHASDCITMVIKEESVKKSRDQLFRVS